MHFVLKRIAMEFVINVGGSAPYSSIRSEVETP